MFYMIAKVHCVKAARLNQLTEYCHVMQSVIIFTDSSKSKITPTTMPQLWRMVDDDSQRQFSLMKSALLQEKLRILKLGKIINFEHLLTIACLEVLKISRKCTP